MRLGSRACVVALLFAAVSPLWGATPYQSKTLNPQHVRELQASIQEWAQKVNCAKDPEARGRCQEELCKRLVQAQDYDNALRVASAVHQTRGIDAERRAAHHFLLAKIYALKMEASPNLLLMEENRRRAIRTVQDVLRERYPSKWMVSDAAQGLLKELEDPRHIEKVRAWVEKRQCGGADPEKLAKAQAQSDSIERAVRGGVSRPVRRPPSNISLGSSAARQSVRVECEPAKEDLALRLSRIRERSGSSQKVAGSEIYFSGGTRVSYSRDKGAYSVQDASPASQRKRSTTLSSPIIIDGTSVRTAPAQPRAQQ